MSEREVKRRAAQSQRDHLRNSSFSIDEWCAHRRVSRGLFYKMIKLGIGPRTHMVGVRRLISAEADAEWLAQREDQAAEAVA